MSRNRLVIRARARELKQASDGPPGFFEELSAIDCESAAAVDELQAQLKRQRLQKLAENFGTLEGFMTQDELRRMREEL